MTDPTRIAASPWSFTATNYDAEDDFLADRTLRHKAVRKLHQAEWAQFDGDTDDAVAEMRRACALVMKMQFPVAGAVFLMAQGIEGIRSYCYEGEAMKAANSLIAPGEEVRDDRSPF